MPIPTITPAPTAQSLQRRDEWVLPLTTIFTPPSNCLTDPFTLDHPSSAGEAWAWRDWEQTSASCYPSAFYTLQHSWNWYSPGVCPSGYGIAQSRIMSSQSVPVTQAWCCQSDFTISGSSSAGKDYQYCTSTATGASALSIVNNSRVLTSVTQFVAYQWPMSVQWASSDLGDFTPASAPLLSAGATTIYSLPSTAVIGTTSADTGPGVPSTTPSGGASSSDNAELSTAAKAGIGVGVAVGTILAVLAFAFWFLRKRKHRRMQEKSPQPVSATDERSFFGGKAELPDDGRQAQHRSPAELSADGQTPQEMGSDEYKATAMQKTPKSPVEMEAEYHPQHRTK